MTKIILFGNQSDSRLTLPFCRVLAENGGVLYCQGAGIAEYSHVSPEFFVMETDSLPFYSADKTIVVFKQDGGGQLYITPSESVAAIAESSNGAAFMRAKRVPAPVVTYSMGTGGCLSVSSFGDSRAVISVNKSITLLSGKSLEPCEIAVRFKRKPDSYSLLPLCGVMILCEKFKGNLIEL